MPSQIDLEAAERNLKQGNQFKKNGQLDEAIEKYKTAVALHPEYVDGLKQLATAYQAKKELNKAVKCYETILILKPKNAAAY